MDAAGIVVELKTAGVELDLVEDGLRVSPASRVPPWLRDEIRANKPALVAFLQEQARPGMFVNVKVEQPPPEEQALDADLPWPELPEESRSQDLGKSGSGWEAPGDGAGGQQEPEFSLSEKKGPPRPLAPGDSWGCHASVFLSRLRDRHGIEVSLGTAGRLNLRAPSRPPEWLQMLLDDAAPYLTPWLHHLRAARACPVLSEWIPGAAQEIRAGRFDCPPEERWERWADHAALEGVPPEGIWEREVVDALLWEQFHDLEGLPVWRFCRRAVEASGGEVPDPNRLWELWQVEAREQELDPGPPEDFAGAWNAWWFVGAPQKLQGWGPSPAPGGGGSIPERGRKRGRGGDLSGLTKPNVLAGGMP